MEIGTAGPGFRVGVHLSMAGGLERVPERAAALGCGCFQMFLGSPRSWRPPLEPGSPEGRNAVEAFRRSRRSLGMDPAVGHVRYLVNLLSEDRVLFRRSLDCFVREAVLAEALGLDFLVVHPGSEGRDVSSAVSGDMLGSALREALGATSRVEILLEPMARPPSRAAGNIRFLSRVIASERRLGLCLDLAHLCSQGYALGEKAEVERLLSDLKEAGGLDRVRLIHGNDSAVPAGSFRDRHWHVARGVLGRRGFLNILSVERFRRVPWVLETPKKPEGSDRKNLRLLERLASEAVKWRSRG